MALQVTSGSQNVMQQAAKTYVATNAAANSQHHETLPEQVLRQIEAYESNVEPGYLDRCVAWIYKHVLGFRSNQDSSSKTYENKDSNQHIDRALIEKAQARADDLKSIIQLIERVVASHHLDTREALVGLMELGRTYATLGYCRKGIIIQSDAIKEYQKLADLDEIEVGRLQCQIGHACVNASPLELEFIEQHHTEGMKILNRKLGSTHPETLDCLLDLAHIYFLQGKHELSLRYYQATLLGLQQKIAELTSFVDALNQQER